MPSRLPDPRITLPLVLAAWVIALLAAPAERTLGSLVRWVYAHASLTQTSLLLFGIAAVLAVIYLTGKASVRNTLRSTLYPWLEVTGWVALGLWLAGFVLSTIPARLSWGVWVDFNEPRTQMTLRVLAVGALFLLLTRWVESRRFTAAAQIALSVVVLFLNRRTGVIRHPFNPIAQAETIAIPLAYSLILLVALIGSGLLIAYVVARRPRPDVPRQISP